MSAAERKFFEAQLSKDPLLQNEVNFHKDVIEGLQEYRKKALKERLNNIDVKGGSSSYTGIKIAASAVLLSIIGLGTYYFTTNKKEQAPTPVVYSLPEVSKEAAPENPIPTTSEKVNSDVASSPNIVAKKEVREKKKETAETTEEHVPIFNAPNVKERFEEDEQSAHEETLDAPQGGITKAETPKLSSVEIKIEESKSNKLQYQHYNNKLFLYGDFNSKPYEILELNSNKESKLYIYFEDKYYALKSNQIKVANLEEIKNAKLIESLKTLRDK